MNSRRRLIGVLALLTPLAPFGCSDPTPVETGYGRSRGESVNGTGVLAEMFREGGHEVRAAVRLTDELGDWADVIVRFAPFGGPPLREEADWFDLWMDTAPGRRVIYVVRDHDCDADYWVTALEQLPSDADPKLRGRVQKALNDSRKNEGRFPSPADDKGRADAQYWFAVEPPLPSTAPVASPVGTAALAAAGPSAQACATLEGPWAAGVSGPRAAVPFRRWLRSDSEVVLLACGDRTLAMSWLRNNDSRVLVVANGSFLLNAGLAARPGRRPLADRVVAWGGFDGGEGEGEQGTEVPKRVAFVEGFYAASEPASQPSVFDLLKVEPFGKVAAQLLAVGLAACLARAPRLGRARPEEPSGADRPAAHPEALGALLARTGQASVARSLLETYRGWRQSPAGRAQRRPGPPHRID